MSEAQDATDQEVKRMRRIPSVREVVAMVSWSVLVGMGGFGLAFVFYATGGGLGGPAGQELITQGHAIILGATALALAPWVIVGVRWWMSASEELPDLAPMPEEYADFARKLEDFTAESGTLICFECGHHNPVGQSQCEVCDAWVPQTAKARWAYGPRTDES